MITIDHCQKFVIYTPFSDKDKNKAETQRDASNRLIKELDQKTKSKQAEVNRRLQDRFVVPCLGFRSRRIIDAAVMKLADSYVIGKSYYAKS